MHHTYICIQLFLVIIFGGHLAHAKMDTGLHALTDAEVQRDYSFVVDVAGSCNGFVAEDRRIVVTALHCLFSHEKGSKIFTKSKRKFWNKNKLLVERVGVKTAIDKCRKETYGVSKVFFGGREIDDFSRNVNAHEDYAILVLDRPVCESVTPVPLVGLELRSESNIITWPDGSVGGNLDLGGVVIAFTMWSKHLDNYKHLVDEIKSPYGTYRVDGTLFGWGAVDKPSISGEYSLGTELRIVPGSSGSACLATTLTGRYAAVGIAWQGAPYSGGTECVGFGSKFMKLFSTAVNSLDGRQKSYRPKTVDTNYFK